MSATAVPLVVSGSIWEVLITIARAALSRRARSAAWFAAGTVSTSATSATIASGHQILALTSSSVNLSNTEMCAPPIHGRRQRYRRVRLMRTAEGPRRKA